MMNNHKENLLRLIHLHLHGNRPGFSVIEKAENKIFEYFDELIRDPELTKKVLDELEQGHLIPRWMMEEHRKERLKNG